jgi:hypothetical protein
LTTPKVLQEHSNIIGINIGIAVNVTITWSGIGTWIIVGTPAKITQESIYVIGVYTT